MNIPCVLIPVIVGLICAILGYLLGKMFSKSDSDSNSLQYDLDNCLEKSNQYSKKIAALEIELALAKKNSVQSFVGTQAPLLVFDSALAATVYGKKIKENDLKVVEGIGPKIEELYHQHGITTWKILSETSTEKLQKILDEEGERFMIHNAGTWARQAALAYKGEWKELKEWQGILDGGKE
jgi:predicted flap endonuclease-1-like 5' DNA nuclease